MKLRKELKMILPASVGMMILILDSNTAAKGAAAGLEVCLRTVLPSLFPFVFLSSLLSSTLISGTLPGSKVLSYLYRIPDGTEGILLTGLLGGYPVGAKCVGEAVANGHLSHDDGKRMLIFCNAAGPAFLFGIAGSLFSQQWIPWCLWGLHIFSGLCAARLISGTPGRFETKTTSVNMIVSQRLRQSVQIMGDICGWIILMRIVITFITKWFLSYLPEPWHIFTAGILELSNGCVALSKIQNTGLRFILCSVFLGFGGLCVALQTRSAASMVDQKYYLPGKIIQGVISFLISYVLQLMLFEKGQQFRMPWLFLPILLVVFTMILFSAMKPKKSCGNLEHIGV